MRRSDGIFDIWESGFYAGNQRAHGRVTVEPAWYLNTTGASYAGSKSGPFRYYEDQSGVQIEVPNIKSIAVDRSIDTDVGTCKIQMYNQKMAPNIGPTELADQLGMPGYFSWGRGTSPEAVARWNHEVNEWEDVIVPNALIRTYEGFGGFETDGSPMSIQDCVEGGYLVLSGVWLVDTVALNSSGLIDISCRDVGKLLLVQQMFPPLIPSRLYRPGIELCRWQYTTYESKYNERKPYTTPGSETVRPPGYFDSSADRWYGYNADIHGHRGTDSVDGNDGSYALSVGNSHPSKAFCTDWWEYEVNGSLNQVYVHTWAGNYQMYISVLENGVWQSNGQGNVPYDPSELYSSQTTVDTGASIPFVMQTGTPWEQGVWYDLGRYYNAQRIRISFRNHTYTDMGPWHYRAGIREVLVRASTSQTYGAPMPWTVAASGYNDPTAANETGYWVAADDGQVFAFGDARVHDTLNSPYQPSGFPTFPITSIVQHPDGQGYWLLQTNGAVYAYGSAQFEGDATTEVFLSQNANVFDMACTPSGNGYWIICRDGTVIACGDATHHGNMPVITSNGTPPESYYATGIESHPTLDGYWITSGNGQVRAFGSLTSYGEISPFRDRMFPNEWIGDIVRTSSGNGYWLLGGGGHVYAYGDATSYGDGIPAISEELMTATDDHAFRHITWELIPSANDDGYMLLQANGSLIQYGTTEYFGQPGSEGQLRSDGNYGDYADIVKLILGWAGFTWWDTGLESGEAWPPVYTAYRDTDAQIEGDFPPIYGNIEYTGAYAEECLDPSLFDKKPPIDAINMLKEIVGYIFYIDQEGAAHFESPNWWSIGNFWEDGTPTDFIPEVDERTVLTNYTVSYNDEAARSEIIIATEDPTEANSTTVTTRLTPQSASILRGMVKPAMWTNGVFKNKDEQQIMAELIAMHIWFQQRVGQVESVANPCIQPNDQIRIFERTTGETFVHYVRGVSSAHDLDTGQYTMTLSTHWLGDADSWVISKDNVPGSGVVMSDALRNWLANSPARSVSVARMNDFNGSTDPALITVDPNDPIDTGSANP